MPDWRNLDQIGLAANVKCIAPDLNWAWGKLPRDESHGHDDNALI